MNRYIEFDITSVASSGNVQEGYVPVLTIDAWKAQVHITTTMREKESVAFLRIPIDSGKYNQIRIADVRKLLTDMEANACESVEVTTAFEYDEGEYNGAVLLHSDVFRVVPKNDSCYLKEYRIYASHVLRQNRDIWNAYAASMRDRDVELARLKELAAKYPDQVKSIAGSM